MAYVAVVKAMYDYTAQDPETELSFKEDQIIYIIEKEDGEWWKGKVKDDGGEEGAVGLIPASYVEETPPMHQIRSIYAYESTSPEEISMEENAVLHVHSAEDDWLLVRVEGGSAHLGFVPRNYCEELDSSAAVGVADAGDIQGDVDESREEEEALARQRESSERQRQLKLKDKVETWSISEIEGKKKKKGTLGVGNGAVFFASDTDKMTPVKQYPITELEGVSQPSSKNLQLTFSSLGQPLLFHTGSSSTASAILAKLETNKAAAGEALEMIAAEAAVSSGDEHDDDVGTAEPKTVRFAAQSAAPSSNGVSATVQYDFDAQGEDELSVREGEVVTVVEQDNEEWWLVRNSAGTQGVVPATYVEVGGGAVGDGPSSAQHAEDEAAAAAALEAERRREKERAAEQRRAIERAAREKREQEDQDRKYAEEVEAKEAAKAERRAARRAQEAREAREEEAQARRENARRSEPPKVSRRPSAQNVQDAAASLPTRSKQAPQKPPDTNRPKPNVNRVRVWSDKTGQFKVEAEYLGLSEDRKIRLHKLNGVIIEVPIERMAAEDVQMIKRHETRKQRAAQEAAEDDVPLGRTVKRQSSTPVQSISTESKVRAESPIPAAALEMPKPRKARYDWFAFFLEAGCDMDDCTRYQSNFERDRIDESILPDLDAGTLRSLGLKEGDVIRVRKEINNRFAKKTPEQEAQMKVDEEYARQLQEHENSGGKGPIPQPPPGLFTGPDGKLSNNTRRGRPEKKTTGTDTVDASVIAAASESLTKVSISPPSPPPTPKAPSPPPEKAAPLIAGFDDDAWTIKPSISKPASPAPPPPTAVPPRANTVDSLLAQIQSYRPNTGVTANNTGGSGNFDRLSQMVAPNQTGSSGFSGSSYGLGVQNTGQPMGQMQMQPQNTARGPVAPVPSNEGLLNPLQPMQTGFVPTRGGVQPGGYGQQQSPVGMMPQQTGFMQQGMMAQPTGYAQGFQQGYGGPPQQQLQPNFTGFPGNYGQQSQQSSFNAIANVGPPPPPQQNGDKFAPTNIFAAMRQTEFGKPEEQQPQTSNKYDALRPLTTGYNGPPQGNIMAQQTGMMPQQTGMMMQGQPQGMMGMGMGMGGMGQQMTGMGPQMTGYNPQMGYMGQQQGYGQYR